MEKQNNYPLVAILVNAQNICKEDSAQKILGPVPYAQGFHFFMPDGHYTGETAMSLSSFLRDMRSIDTQSIKFHFDRGDFQKWLRTTVGDEELAQTIDKLDKKIPEENLGLLAVTFWLSAGTGYCTHANLLC